MAGGELLGGGDGALRPAFVVPGKQVDGASRDAALGIGLFDGEDNALMDRRALNRQDPGAGVDLSDRDRLGGDRRPDESQEDDREEERSRRDYVMASWVLLSKKWIRSGMNASRIF